MAKSTRAPSGLGSTIAHGLRLSSRSRRESKSRRTAGELRDGGDGEGEGGAGSGGRTQDEMGDLEGADRRLGRGGADAWREAEREYRGASAGKQGVTPAVLRARGGASYMAWFGSRHT
jgi:hypothetical protein